MKSKKRSKSTSGKQLEEPPVFFLDRTFGKTKLAEMLRPSGFLIATHYEEYGPKGEKVADPVMIRDCGFKNRVLLTGDQDLVHAYALEIKEAKIAVFVTTNNNEGPAQWGPRIIAAKSDIWRELGRRKKPFTARISTEGRITQVRVYDQGTWKAITIGRKNPPHTSNQRE